MVAAKHLASLFGIALFGCCVAQSAVLASERVSATTLPAKVLAGAAVTGYGSLNDVGLPAAWRFEYYYVDRGVRYDIQSSKARAPGSTGVQLVSQPLDDLATGESYKYRLVVTTSNGSTYGAWLSFVTPWVGGKVVPPRGSCVVPNVLYEPEPVAAKDIARAGCKLGAIRYSSRLNRALPRRTVVWQSLRPNRRVAARTRITIALNR
jgi:hypothetical protein